MTSGLGRWSPKVIDYLQIGSYAREVAAVTNGLKEELGQQKGVKHEA